MKKHLLLIATCAVAALALLTASVAFARSSSPTLRLTARDNGKSFSVTKGTTIVITLKSCSDCGYQWKRGPSSGVKFLSHRYVQHHKKGTVGGEGKEIWRFSVVGPKSEGEIQLRYVSPAKKITQRFVVGLRISS